MPLSDPLLPFTPLGRCSGKIAPRSLFFTMARPRMIRRHGDSGSRDHRSTQRARGPISGPGSFAQQTPPAAAAGPPKGRLSFLLLCPPPGTPALRAFPGQVTGRGLFSRPTCWDGPCGWHRGTLAASDPVVSRPPNFLECVPQAQCSPHLTTPTATGLGVSGAFRDRV